MRIASIVFYILAGLSMISGGNVILKAIQEQRQMARLAGTVTGALLVTIILLAVAIKLGEKAKVPIASKNRTKTRRDVQ